MKEITAYVADDGTIHTDAETCKTYERNTSLKKEMLIIAERMNTPYYFKDDFDCHALASEDELATFIIQNLNDIVSASMGKKSLASLANNIHESFADQ